MISIKQKYIITNRFHWFWRLMFVLMIISSNSNAQSKKIDSAKSKLSKQKDIQKIRTYNDIASLYYNVSLDSGLTYTFRAANLAVKYKQYSELARAYSYAGQFYYYKSDYQSSIASFQQSYTAALKANDKSKVIEAVNNSANVMIDQGMVSQSLEKYKEAATLSKQFNDDKNLAIAYHNLAYVYRSIGDYTKATDYILLKLKIDEQRNDKNSLAYGFQQLGMIYLQKKDYPSAKKFLDNSSKLFKALKDQRNIAVAQSLISNYYEEIGEMKLAQQYLSESISLAEKMKDTRSLAVFQSTYARYLRDDHQYQAAEIAYLKSIELHQKIGLKKTLPSVLVAYGQLLLGLDRKEEAKQYLDKGLQLANQQKQLSDQKSAYDGLTDYFIQQKNTEQALIYKNLFVKAKDSLLNESNNKTINDLNIKYETEKKEEAIKLLNSENALQESMLQKSALELLNNKLELDGKNLLVKNQNLKLSNQQLELQQNKTIIDKNKAEINLLNLNNKIQKIELQRKNLILLLSSLSILIIMLLGWLFFNRYKLKQKALLQSEVIKQQDLAAKAVINAEENERQRMSTTLHDGLGQLLTVVKLNFQSLEKSLVDEKTDKQLYQKTFELIDDSIKEMRSVSHQMVSNTLIRSGLGTALKNLIEKIDTRKIKIQLNIEGLINDVEQHIQLVMYRIFQESINNVIKHAKAGYLDISIEVENDMLHATIEDDGIGFDVTKLSAKAGIGLENMKARVNFLKGEFDIDSSPGKGTLIAIHIPLNIELSTL